MTLILFEEYQKLPKVKLQRRPIKKIPQTKVVNKRKGYPIN